MEKRDLPNSVANRAHAADQWRQLVKRCQTVRFVMNINLRKRTTPEDKWTGGNKKNEHYFPSLKPSMNCL
ncbi:hypothetical protein Bca4012_091715 [Brassica carinata]|uniref:Uncharacterized protein n=1 Tax=Brassica carinata TaxID=52824 RepID=A0A8X7PQ73_BRACI|nr:hypothetical protein Bca52824_074412 [Brassica carinata]